VGDVQLLPSLQEVETPPVTVVEGGFDRLDFAELLAAQGVGDASALAGVQDKVSGRMLTVPLAHEGRTHLLKF
jgi:serine/threonine-protein kinase HipA